MADRFDLTPIDHDPFEAMGAIPGLIPKPNVLQAGPTSLQGNIAGLGLPAGVLAKYAGEQVDRAYDLATLPGDVALGRTDPNSPEGFGRTMGLAMGLAGGPLAGKGGGARMGFGGATVPAKSTAELMAQLEGALKDIKAGSTPPKPLDHSYWGNEVLSAIHDGLPPDQAVTHVKDLAPDSSHAAIDAAAKEYVPHAVELMKQFSADEVMGLSQGIPWAKAYPELSAALPGVKKFLGIEEPKPSHSLTPVDHDPFAGTVPPVDMAALYGGLSMDPAARMERARQLGFNPDQTLFHGRGSGPFQGLEFRDPALKSERAIFATDDPEVAASYAGNLAPFASTHRPEVMPLLARMQNPLNVDYGLRDYHPGKMQSIIEDARARGHDSVIVHGIMDQGSGSPQTQYAIFDPRNLRSKFAAFNPAYRDSANLLSTRGGPFALTPVDHDPWEQR